MEREKMIEEIKGGFTERMRLAEEYNKWLKEEGNKARAMLANNPQTMIAFLQTKGWKEVTDGALVLTKEEYENLKNKPPFAVIKYDEDKMKEIVKEAAKNIVLEFTEKGKDEIRKETASEILNDIVKTYGLREGMDKWDSIGCFNLYKKINALKDKFGVEVEE